RLSFDTQASVERAQQIIDMYSGAGIERERILIKLASTWEGIQAAKTLEAQGIHCNMTLMFSLPQALACAQAKARLISPFVGRIYDWYKKAAGDAWDEDAHAGPNDPGVISVETIYNYYKTYDIPTQVMGASFRNLGQIQALAGCDLLTISPELLQKLAEDEGPLERRLQPGAVGEPRQVLDEAAFRWALNEDAMATEKLAEGSRLFARDQEKLEALLRG